MSKGLEYYKKFIDGLVTQKNGIDEKRILGNYLRLHIINCKRNASFKMQ